MTVREDFEAALRARWDREALVVYGDHLMAENDPRGEMIAIDLAIDERGATPELAARREQLVRACFGDVIPPGTLRYGFFDVDATSAEPSPQLDAAFTGPAAAYVRSIVVCGGPSILAGALEAIASRPRPWLQRLAIRQWPESTAPRPGNRARPAQLGPTGADLTTALIGASPHLETLELDGERIFEELAHPAVRRLRISGHDATASLAGDGPPLPSVVALDFAFHSHLGSRTDSPGPATQQRLLAPARFPALVDLDLSRNEPGRSDPISLGGTIDICRFVADRAIVAQLERLRLPTVLAVQVRAIEQMLRIMPALRELTVRTLPAGVRLAHPHAAIRIGADGR